MSIKNIYRDRKQVTGCLEKGLDLGLMEIVRVVKIFQNWIVVMVAYLYKFTKNYFIVFFQCVYFMLYKLHQIKLLKLFQS